MKRISKSTNAGFIFIVLILSALLIGCRIIPGKPSETSKARILRIIATSDLHGKFMPWDYATDSESDYGSLAQLSTAIKEYRNDDTLLFDA